MPADVLETQIYPATVQGPAGGEPRTAASVRAMGSPLASRTLWLRKQNEQIFGAFKAISSVSVGGNTLEIAGHGYVDDQPICVVNVGGALPTPLFANLVVYVIVDDADNIKIALTAGGAAIDLTDAGTGAHYAFTVTDSLAYLRHAAFATAKGDTIPAGRLKTTLQGYYLPTLGGTITGEVTRSGDAATEVKRVGYLTDADETFDPTTADVWYCQDVTANRTFSMVAPAKQGLEARIIRLTYANAFAGLFKRAADASTVGRLNAVGAIDLVSITLGGVTKWHAAGLGGADQIS